MLRLLASFKGLQSGGRRELARIRHSTEKIGGGIAKCMDVDLPTLKEDGSPVCWCTSRIGKAEIHDKLSLESRRPKWSKKLQGLTLDFFGRAKYSSAKNFQLRSEENADEDCKRCEDVELLYGKAGDNLFVLDYKYPLSMVQAFAIALSTNRWVA